MSQFRPEEIARHTVERNGGEYKTDVADLLSLFGRKQLSDKARKDVRNALQSEGVGTDPDLFVAKRSDQIRLFLLERATAGGWSARPSAWSKFRPRTWKGWLAYAVVLLVVISALSDGSDDGGEPNKPASNVTEQQPSEDAEATAAARRERRAARLARERVRKERAQLRRERAQVRRQRARARARVRAAALERERQERLEAEAIAAEEAAAAEAVASCHPSYDPCLDPNASDYDCEGGEGDGPEYTGLVTVTGSDDYDLDRDGDGTGCDT